MWKKKKFVRSIDAVALDSNLRNCVLVVIAVGLIACASARVSHRSLDDAFKSANFSQSSEIAKKGIEKQGEDGRDLLLYLLDGALSLSYEGKWEESNQLFSQADKVSEIKEYTSLAEESASIVTTENLKAYKGEEFETVLINVFKMINYAQLGDTESALVEARVTNRKLRRLREEAKRKYDDNAFAEYFSGVLYEANGDFNDAYISYKKAAKILPQRETIGTDLFRTAWLSGFKDEAGEYASTYGLKEETVRAQKMFRNRMRDNGELVVIFENGLSPVKVPHPNWRSLPTFQARWNPVRRGLIRVDSSVQVPTVRLFDVEAAAISNLEQKYAGLIARRLVGVVAKEVIADQLEKQTKIEGLGALTRLVLHAADQADLRSWSFLPKDLQIARVELPAGKHQVLAMTDPIGVFVTGTPLQQEVNIRPGKKTFLRFRLLPK